MKRLALGLVLTVAASGCFSLLEPADLQGTWLATSLVLTEADNPGNSVDILDESDVAALEFTFDLNIYRSRVVSLSGVEEFFEDEYVLDGSFITFLNFRGEEETRFGIEIDNETTMRLNDPVTDWDLDGDGENDLVIMDVFLTRQ
jgi:hypothetical protein